MIVPGQPMTLGSLFADTARYFGDMPALICGDETRSHAELYRNACRLAASLEGLGMRKQDRLAVLSMNNIEFVETYLAGWTAGFIVATVNFRLALPEIVWVLGDIAPRVLVIEAQYAGLIEAIRAAVPVIEQVVVIGAEVAGTHGFARLIEHAPADMPRARATPEDIASLIYTSGTTGRPKGCILGQGEMAFNAQMTALIEGAMPGDRFLCVMPLFHIGATNVGLSVLVRGGCAHIHRQFDAAAVAESLERDGINVTLLAPTMVQMVLQVEGVEARDYARLRMIVYSAAPMPTPVLRRGIAVFGPVFLQMLGSSEGCGIAYLPQAVHRPDGDERDQRRLLSVGFACPTVGLRVVDDDGVDCAPGEVGEVVLKSPVMFRGYWNNSIATAEAIRDGWYFSGDVGRFDEDGYLYLVDRKKDMIISGGENIYSREVEEALLQHPAVSEVAVIGRPDETWGETVCAVVVLRQGMTASADELIAHSRSLIASYKKPRDVVFVKELPKVASGKVDKRELRALHGATA